MGTRQSKKSVRSWGELRLEGLHLPKGRDHLSLRKRIVLVKAPGVTKRCVFEELPLSEAGARG